MVSDYFRCSLALDLGMSLAELDHGRGTPMSNHELTVVWPAFFRARNEIQAHQVKEAQENQ